MGLDACYLPDSIAIRLGTVKKLTNLRGVGDRVRSSVEGNEVGLIGEMSPVFLSQGRSMEREGQ
jgi:hypothetical protein